MALGAHGLGDGDDAALGEPTQHDLCHRLAVLLADLGQQRVGEQAVPPFGEAAPGLDLHAVFAHEPLVVGALKEGVGLDLVDHRGDLVVDDQVDQAVGVEVGHADRLGRPFAVERLHGAPLAVDVAEGLVIRYRSRWSRPSLFREVSNARLVLSSDSSISCGPTHQ